MKMMARESLIAKGDDYDDGTMTITVCTYRIWNWLPFGDYCLSKDPRQPPDDKKSDTDSNQVE